MEERNIQFEEYTEQKPNEKGTREEYSMPNVRKHTLWEKNREKRIVYRENTLLENTKRGETREENKNKTWKTLQYGRGSGKKEERRSQENEEEKLNQRRKQRKKGRKEENTQNTAQRHLENKIGRKNTENVDKETHK